MDKEMLVIDDKLGLMLNGRERFVGKKILVVDDEPDLLKVTLVRLKKTGYEVYGCTDGREVLDIVRRVIPDLIILDVYLPILNGDEFAKILKRDARLKHIPIILISADTKTVAERARLCGADGYLAKPFEPEELVGMVENALERQGGVKIEEIKMADRRVLTEKEAL